ncbi:MAG TPA: hypothetical protein VKD69_24770 [Vicinamibacterales bacterium]|nr:hypothetical protein [Vicinamibacterales bacterium]
MFAPALFIALLAVPLAQHPPEVSEKTARTPVRQKIKINSHLLCEIHRRRGEAERIVNRQPVRR